MHRRSFISTVAGALHAAPLGAEAQQAEKVYRVGFLSMFPGSDPDAFVQGLREAGYVEGQNLNIERRFAEGKAERLPSLAADLVRLGVSLIITTGVPPSLAARDATGTVPIVFVGVADPIGVGLVANLARPGGNVTGLASIEWEAFTAKQLQIIKEALPKTSRVAILINPTNRMHALTLPQEQAAADRMRVRLQLVEAREAGDLEGAFEAMAHERADFLHVWGDPLTNVHRVRIAELAMKHRLPTMHFFREAVVAGGLLGFGPNWRNTWRGRRSMSTIFSRGRSPRTSPWNNPRDTS
jgi:putative tryptophan/tyrosine transport system substrate-binding protein